MDIVNRLGRVLTGGDKSPTMGRNTLKKKNKLEGLFFFSLFFFLLLNKQTQYFTIGYLFKKNPAGIGFKKRWFQLNDLILYYFETDKSSASKGKIELMNVLEVTPEPTSKVQFSVKMSDRSRVYVLQTTEPDERDFWYSFIIIVHYLLFLFLIFVISFKKRINGIREVISNHYFSNTKTKELSYSNSELQNYVKKKKN